MGKVLIIAEKPSVANDIAKALGGFSKVDDYHESSTALISSGIGHLIEIYSTQADNAKGLHSLPVIPQAFELRPISKTESQYRLLSKLMKRDDVDEIVNACDAGREGELIFRLIYEAARCKKPTRRMWIQSMTPASIIEAYRNLRPGSEYNNLGDAARCRSEADWLVGINGSRGITSLRELQTQKYELQSAGRVQTPTAALIVELEEKIRNFVPEDYWEVHATFAAVAGSYVGKWVGADHVENVPDSDESGDESKGQRIYEKAKAETIIVKCRGLNPSSVTDESTVTQSLPPKLFDLTTLQREANKKFKFSAKKTLDIAQKLYEKHKALSYPRTDSSALPEDYVGKVHEIMQAFAGTDYGQHAERVLGNSWIRLDKRIFDNTKISDHFAIIPNGTRPSDLDADEAKIYEMVTRRFLAVFHPAAEYNKTTRTSIIANEKFITRGKVLIKQGWLAVYGISVSDKNALCAVSPSEQVATSSVDLKALQTTAPSRFTEATLLTAMETAGKLLVDDEELREVMKGRGLGTPATRASIIEGLLADMDSQKRKKEPMIVREGKEQYLVPTGKCEGLIKFLKSNGIEMLTSPRMTGEWEHKLHLMESGKYRRDDFMREIADMTTHIISVIRQQAAQVPAAEERILKVSCPKCASDVISGQRFFQCKTDSCLKFFRKIAERDLSDGEAEQLLRDGAITTPLSGFYSAKTKNKFSAGLKLDMSAEYQVSLVFEERAPGQANNSGPELGVPCPKCGGAIRFRDGNYPVYSCEKGDFKLWKVAFGRKLSDAEAKTLITKRELPAVHGFVSTKTKNKYTAGLKLSRDLDKVELVFEPK